MVFFSNQRLLPIFKFTFLPLETVSLLSMLLFSPWPVGSSEQSCGWLLAVCRTPLLDFPPCHPLFYLLKNLWIFISHLPPPAPF